MQEIRLQRSRWKYDPSNPLGPEGGFGAVFRGESEDGEVVAVKRLKLTADEAAHRELEIADELVNRSFQNVLPVLDSGQDAETGRYFLVMPEAENSLKDYIEQGGSLPDADAARILLAIAAGLQEVPELVHRDLKPANILLHSGHWKIADFGIAKFVQESTSLRTLKQCLSPPYAAPEQWRLQRASGATDVYALGCIGHAILTGSPPFSGPSMQEYQDQHLNDEPPHLNVTPQIRSLLSMMLRKVPDTRPSIERVSSVLKAFLDDVDKNNSENCSPLADAGAAVAEQESKEEAEKARKAERQKRRKDLAFAATRILSRQVGELFCRIEDEAPAARRALGGDKMVLGQGSIEICGRDVNPIEEGAFPESGWDVILGCVITVSQSDPEYAQSASLWYAKRPQDDDYRWLEVSYFKNPLMRHPPRFQPYSLDVPAYADIAHSNVIGTHQVAWGPSPIDDEDAEDFCQRWMSLLAQASQGNLRNPRRLPLR